MNKLLYVLLLSLTLLSCVNKDINEIKKELDSNNNIIFSELDVSNNLNKVILRIVLKEKMNEEDLKQYSLELKNKYLTDFKNIYIFYDLNKDDDIGWAYCHFRPDMEFNIIGSSIVEDSKMKDKSDPNNIKGFIIGQWKCDKSLSGGIITLVKRDSEIYNVMNFKDGGKIEENISILSKNNEKRYVINDFGEYYIIEKNGNLGMYGENGKFDEAKKMN